MSNILICDDEKDIVSALRICLAAEGYEIFEAYNGIQALEIIKANDIHLVLLDIMMPEMDGISTLAKIRERYNMPVLFISAKSEDADKILGLNIGADDYITKPFNIIEVVARVKSNLRRYMRLGSNVSSSRIEIRGLCLDDNEKTVAVDGRGDKSDADRIRNSEAAYAKSRQGVFSKRDIRKGMERNSARKREHSGGAYKAFERKA